MPFTPRGIRTNQYYSRSSQIFICNSTHQTIDQINREPSSQSGLLYFRASFCFHYATSRSGFTCIFIFAFYSYAFFPAVYLLSVYRKCWVLRKITKARLLIQKKTWIETTSFERNEVYPCVNNVSNEFSITRNGIEQQIGSVWVILKQIYHKNPVCFSLSNLQLSKGILKFCSFPRCLNLHCLPLFHSCITNHL